MSDMFLHWLEINLPIFDLAFRRSVCACLFVCVYFCLVTVTVTKQNTNKQNVKRLPLSCFFQDTGERNFGYNY